MSQARFQKQQREKARRERAAAKWARRHQRQATEPATPTAVSPTAMAELLGELVELHARYDAGTIELDDFLDAKDDLTRRLDLR